MMLAVERIQLLLHFTSESNHLSLLLILECHKSQDAY